MKILKYDTVIMLFIFAFLWAFACNNSHPTQSNSPEDRAIFLSDLVKYQTESAVPTFEGFIEWIQDEIPDTTCTPQPITEPTVKCIAVLDVTVPTTQTVRIKWRGQTVSWILNGLQVIDKIEVLTDLIDNHITYDSLIVIDKSIVTGTDVTLDFTMCFTNSVGQWHNSNTDNILFEFLGTKTIAMWKQKLNSISSPYGSTSEELSGLYSYARGWEAIWLFGNQLDSTSLVPVLDAALGTDCKGQGKIDLRGHVVSQEYVDEFNRRGIIVNQ